MALKKHITTSASSSFSPSNHSTSANAPKKEADDLRRQARTLARKQQAAERVASATAELLAGLEESSSAMTQ
ncbi:hypothetical protein, partial [Klebsiella pneumoniae]